MDFYVDLAEARPNKCLSAGRDAEELLPRGRLNALSPIPNMQDVEFNEVIELICKEDGRYDRKAYTFIRQGLDQTVKEIRKKDAEKAQRSRHVSGPELLEGLRVYALDQYGPLTKTVLNSWGIKRCQDFGDLVFNLIEYNVFSKTESDKREDFADIYTFDDAFVKPFLPKKKPRQPGTATETVGPA
jgi:uncharacterized repeat protein (TIGR04138 family)